MADTSWLSVGGFVTGCIGAVTGVMALRKTGALKALDLRLRVRQDESKARFRLVHLIELIEVANHSKRNRMAERGMFQSGMMTKWTTDVQNDRNEVTQLLAGIPDPAPDYRSLDHDELETKIVSLNGLHTQIDHLYSKYEASIEKDKVR